MAESLTVGHEQVGIIEKLGSGVQGLAEGQRVVAGAATPSGHSAACLCSCSSQDGLGTRHGFKAMDSGASVTPSTGRRPKIFSFPRPWPTSLRFPTASSMSRC